jgi:hypothetical protein
MQQTRVYCSWCVASSRSLMTRADLLCVRPNCVKAILATFTGGCIFVEVHQSGVPTRVFADEEGNSLGGGAAAANLREHPPESNEQPPT